MEKLMKPSEYAKELGISRQAVYAKIKRGILTAKDVEGKLYIVVDSAGQTQNSGLSEKKTTSVQNNRKKVSLNVTERESEADYKRLLAAKDETIQVLKDTVEDLKESNRQMSGTLKGEIDLLKSAFSEMRSLYMHRIEQMEAGQVTNSEGVLEADVKSSEPEEWIGIKKFFKYSGIHGKEDKTKVHKKLKKAYKRGDKRLIKEDGKLKVDISRAYSDLLE